jgi:hypothetical protein
VRTNRENLVKVARAKGIANASSWLAVRDTGGTVLVSHYGTLMVSVNPDDTVTPESRGWGSMSDKQGIRAILRQVSGQSYRDVFGS